MSVLNTIVVYKENGGIRDLYFPNMLFDDVIEIMNPGRGFSSLDREMVYIETLRTFKEYMQNRDSMIQTCIELLSNETN